MFPTESSYALGVDPENRSAVAAVYRLKRRPVGKPLPVVVGEQSRLRSLGIELQDEGLSGLEQAWPGALTVILPCSRPLPAACGRYELAVRIPGHLRLRKLLAESGIPLTATSANLAGDEPVLDPAELARWLDANALLIDEGPLPSARPSTIVRLEGRRATVVRTGAVAVSELRELAPTVEFDDGFSAVAVEKPVEEGP